ncbi:histidine kinase dimerization/phospho-acceptor domain-containing protein [Vulgatibacter incomptus]|uniref:histidine kinase n=1 Tax=Vulgatibacter incomptus TaxID=1391653 RepID=A0A0K1PAC0_9BACT|nr:histidine kinase dimerization/phospho-acceptor domain-containing protein [Vulgatibacter incomptus]AKU90361.1 Flagellar sensor histidine kinase FleS [Vulgatibacter incomptus]
MGAVVGPIAPRDGSERYAAGDVADEPFARLGEAERAALLARLSAGLSHETRNSLNSLAIHLEVLADKIREPDGRIPAALERNLKAARAQIRRMDELVRRFAEFASGRREDGEVHQLALDAAELCAFQLRRAGTTLSLEIPAGLRVGGESGFVCRILVEVLLACAAPGSLRLEAAREDGIVWLGVVLEAEDDVGPPLELLALAERLGGGLDRLEGSVERWAMRIPLGAGIVGR